MPPAQRQKVQRALFVLIKLKVRTLPVSDWMTALQTQANQAEHDAPLLAQQLFFHSHSQAVLRHPE